MSSLKMILKCIFGPRLIKVYGQGHSGVLYEQNTLEKWSDQVINSFYIMCKLGIYTSPLLIGVLYRKGYLVGEGLVTLTKFVTGLGAILVVSYCIRGMSRFNNPVYQKFVKVLHKATVQSSESTKKALALYDFDFYAWPVDYDLNESNCDTRKPRIEIKRNMPQRNMFQSFLAVPCKVISYLAVNTFGIRLLYPGSVGLLQAFLAQSLLQGRSKLIESNGGRRYKLKTGDNNQIDTMFVDNRGKSQNGNTLVICCEGNAGFYEIGIMCTPIEANYSTLGWNHPGFGGSTGTPFPEQEHNAIDTVMRFAIDKLGFKEEDILLFGWSIGGFSSTWAAMNYDKVKGLILDASFDDLMPLAVNHMPKSLESIVRMAVREHVNLNISEQLANYGGPVALVRRTQDEVVCTSEGNISTNRGNNLLIKLLKSRYPYIVGEQQVSVIQEFLAANANGQEKILQGHDVDIGKCQQEFMSQVSGSEYPMRIGKNMSEAEKCCMTLFLVKKYMKDYKSTHCTPLPLELFQIPWDVKNW